MFHYNRSKKVEQTKVPKPYKKKYKVTYTYCNNTFSKISVLKVQEISIKWSNPLRYAHLNTVDSQEVLQFTYVFCFVGQPSRISDGGGGGQ